MRGLQAILVFFKKDPFLKLTSLFIAIILWFFIVVKGQTEITISVPLELKYIPKGLGVESKSVSTVMVSVKGFEQIIKNLRPYDVKVSVDLSKAKRGMNVFYLSSRDVILPPSLTVTAIEPSSVRIRLDEVIVKKIPVRPELAGSPPRGYAIAGIKVEPPFVEVEGLRSQISKIKYIPTEQILLDNLSADSNPTVLLEPGINYIKLNPESVRVKIILRSER